MHYRRLGKTNFNVSEVSLGAWQIGGAWGDVPDATAEQVLRTAIERGINFFDTADVYGDGRSERFISKVLSETGAKVIVATKVGRRLQPHTADGYNRENLTAFVERSLKNLQRDALDLVQLHCPPTEVYYRPEVFGILDDLKQAGKILHYGVSVEKVEEAIKAIEFPGLATVQIIFNIFRQRPKDLLLTLARQRDVGVLARLPLSSGLLSGKINRNTTFAADDHRNFNRHGEQFDRGETFSGVDFDIALDAVEEIRRVVPEGMSMANFALRWILDHPAVSCVIPGARNPQQVVQNVAASDLGPLQRDQVKALAHLYDEKIHPLVHQRW
ncbi:MAG TPA: aldo/keto reductase [Chthoniobacterales bacterium]|jgi:aryl-alcohol dehydrogenase-like predicted oxidoreductase|nr:aldo/keto reductase [Chthoniobacterales bacterium]